MLRINIIIPEDMDGAIVEQSLDTMHGLLLMELAKRHSTAHIDLTWEKVGEGIYAVNIDFPGMNSLTKFAMRQAFKHEFHKLDKRITVK